MGKLPYIHFYPADWMIDPELSSCSAAARGVLMDILCLMSQCEKPGLLETKGKPWSAETIAQVVRGGHDQVLACLGELLAKGALHQTQSGAIYSRRLMRDEAKRAAWRKDQANHRVRSVRPMSGPSSLSLSDSSNFSFPQDAKKVANHGPTANKKWVDRDEERRRKNTEALDAVFGPESPGVAENSGGDVPTKPPK